MAEEKSQIPDNNNTSSSAAKKTTPEIGSGSGKRMSYYNPPESFNPDQATLREQWKFAIRQYSKWYSHAWGTAILAGGVFFGLGWIIKGSNPLPSLQSSSKQPPSPSNDEK
ncbi:hypothetical protein CARUB_v10011993mg [Capsella rubella]|uniref:Uncharacterized protein n=1 Tax=Capsella rubella TaxID=81985 RepID=R0IHE3_9BRAS|nr:uncharacterized protein LOC17897715 [Capsella rubella]EOA37820.1 hypothetical protein CARUB_v10011993mg [Capsella rubella]